MSNPKEPNFFSDEERWQRGMKWYQSLFKSAKPNDICGEASTHYTKLPDYPNTIDRIKQNLNNTKFIYVMRHPIDRLISQYIHEWTRRDINTSLEDAIDRYPRLINYSLYSMQLEPYLESFGPSKILPVFQESLILDPTAVLQRICDFISYNKKVCWDYGRNKKNVSSERLRQNKLRDILVWNPISNEIRRRFIPAKLRNRVKKIWQMKETPQLSNKKTQRLIVVFNADLEKLGKWLGLKLTCDNFSSTVSTPIPTWTPANSR